MELGELDDLIKKSIVELDNYRANRTRRLTATSELLEYLYEMLRCDLEAGRVKQPTKPMLRMMSERKYLKLSKNLWSLHKHSAVALRDYIKFIKYADGKQATPRLAEQAVNLRDFLKEFRKFLER